MDEDNREKTGLPEPDSALPWPDAANPRIAKALKLEEQAQRQLEAERLRSRHIEQEQEYIARMNLSVDGSLESLKAEQDYRREYEKTIKRQVYKMHGISEDRLYGMAEARNAYYQGAAFSLFFLSVLLTALCGALHGFGTKICIFMAFFTAVEGALFQGRQKKNTISGMVNCILYLLLFPAMMIIFVCYELGYAEYDLLLPFFVTGGMLVLILGRIAAFVHDPYRADRKNQKRADEALREMEKAAIREVRIREKQMERLEKKKARAAERAGIKEQRKEKRAGAKEQRKAKRAELRQKTALRAEAGRQKRYLKKAERKQARAGRKAQQRPETRETFFHWRKAEHAPIELMDENKCGGPGSDHMKERDINGWDTVLVQQEQPQTAEQRELQTEAAFVPHEETTAGDMSGLKPESTETGERSAAQ